MVTKCGTLSPDSMNQTDRARGLRPSGVSSGPSITYRVPNRESSVRTAGRSEIVDRRPASIGRASRQRGRGQRAPWDRGHARALRATRAGASSTYCNVGEGFRAAVTAAGLTGPGSALPPLAASHLRLALHREENRRGVRLPPARAREPGDDARGLRAPLRPGAARGDGARGLGGEVPGDDEHAAA